MNVLLLKRWLQDNGPGLIGSRLDDVSQLDLRSLLLRFEGDSGTKLMVLSVLDEYPVLAWVDSPTKVPVGPEPESNFCKAVRFHLQGYRLVGIEQQGFDRSVVFTFKHKDVYGEETIKHLRHELAGRATNAFILSGKGMVVSIFKRIKKNPNRVRLIQTGKPLPPPPPLGKFIAAESTAEQLADEMAKIALDDGVEAKGAMKHLFTSRIACCDKKTWPSVGGLLPVEHDLGSLFEFISSFQAGEFTQAVFGLGEAGHDANQAALETWLASRKSRVTKPKTANLQLERLGARMDGLAQQLALAMHAAEVEELGLKLLEVASNNSTADPRAFLSDWQAANPTWAEQIKLNRGIADNGQELVHYAQRLKRALPRLERLIAQTQQDLIKAESAPLSSPQKHQPTNLDKKFSELKGKGVKCLRFMSSDGLQIVCGVSDRGNDQLLRTFGNSRHLWLHAQDYPGSHVLVLSGGQPVPQRTLEEAATVAAYHSRGKDEADLDVSYTSLKYIRRPKNAKPGQVLKTREKVITVRPQAFVELKRSIQFDYSSQ